MGGSLFKEICTSISLEDAHIVVDEIITKIKEKFPDKRILPVGSAGFKEVSSDIDIAIEAASITDLKYTIENVFGKNLYIMEALYIVSMPYKYIKDGEEKWVSVDFIQMVDLYYTRFRYKSPNYLNGGSKYKVGTKIMLVGDLIRLSPVRLTNLRKDQDAWMDYSPIGLYRYVLDKKSQDTFYYKQFITLDPEVIMKMIFKNPKEEWFDSVESIWNALHTEEVVDKEMVRQIEASFFVNCYRKSWEALVHPENFRLDYWTVDEIKEMMAEQAEIRKANQYLDEIL